ncbi:T9SS type A sorting domain-containing protein [Kordia sp.]|uniref:T9SS type A sorting domain-containing protein n=1 Tax=Kordia sp. TaxID=1965332 RepID=UPI003B5A1DC0
MKRKLQYAIVFFIAFTTLTFAQVDLGEDIVTCEGEQVVLDATTANATSYQWTVNGQVDPNGTSATYVATQNGTHEVTAMINGMPSSDSVEVTFNPTPNVDNLTDLTLEGDSGSEIATFDLTSKIPEIVGTNNAAQLNITFHETVIDAFDNINAIANAMSYQNISNPQTMYVRVEDINTGCAVVGNFDLIVLDYTVVDCTDTPAVTTYCYSNNDSTAFRIRSSDDISPVTVEFLAGQVEQNWDELIIIDSDGVTQLYNGYGNNGDLTGLIFESTGNEITVQIQSDGSVSCGTNSYVPWEFTASCVDTQTTGIINTRSFLDENNNGTYDDGEVLFPFGNVLYERNDDGVINVGSANGNFLIVTTDANDSFDFTFEFYDGYENCYNATVTTVNDISVAIGEMETVYFPITVAQPCEDVEVVILNPSAPPRPGFTHYNTLFINNVSISDVASGTVEVIIDDELVLGTVTSADTNYTLTTTATGFTINFTNLQSFESRAYSIELTCPATVPLGQVVTNTASYTTDTNDVIPENNTSTLRETVIGSWDPNDIRESHGPEIIHEEFTTDDFLYYTIRFQNLGTAEAINVRIEETLDAQLDATTFQMIAASHDFQVQRTNDELIWNFDDINLPAEMFDAPGSNGYVYFKIKPLAGYAVGDIIPGVAGIYFDFNAPVITNTFETEFVEPLSVGEVSGINVKIYPNPVTDILYITLDRSEATTIKLLDVQGKQILSTTENSNAIEFDVSNVKSGVYFLKLNSNTAQFTKKIIVN